MSGDVTYAGPIPNNSFYLVQIKLLKYCTLGLKGTDLQFYLRHLYHFKNNHFSIFNMFFSIGYDLSKTNLSDFEGKHFY